MEGVKKSWNFIWLLVFFLFSNAFLDTHIKGIKKGGGKVETIGLLRKLFLFTALLLL